MHFKEIIAAMSQDLNFNANNVKPNTKPDPVPAGEYTAIIVSSEVGNTANGKGKLLKLEFQIADGEHKGRKIWEQLCIQHENEKTQSIAQGQLSAICHATGVLQLRSSSQLHNIPMRIRTVVKQDAGYDPKNEIKGYKAVDGGPPAAASNTAAAPAAASTSAAPPAWAQKKTA